MDFIKRKFVTALTILLAGTILAMIWHGTQWMIGKGYPYSTYLFRPEIRFSDFSSTLSAAQLPNPYLRPATPYPPAAYVLIRPFGWAPYGEIFFLSTGVLALALLLAHVLEHLLDCYLVRNLRIPPPGSTLYPDRHKWRFSIPNVLASFVLLVLCEPLVFCIDRGNIELWLIFMVAFSLYRFCQGRFRASMMWLVLPICLKIYPCVLLALFVRKRTRYLIVVGLAAILFITVLSYACFAGNLIANYQLNRMQLEINAEGYVIENFGLSETATPWNFYRALAIIVHAIHTHTFFNPSWEWQVLEPQFRFALKVYTMCVAACAIAITGYVVLVEREVLRRIVILLLFMVLASPSGAEHKISHIGTALVAFLLIPRYRRGDFLVTALLAFTLIPKKELIFPCFGPSDSGYNDVSAAIFLNPLSMMTALVVLCWNGARAYDPHWSRQRLFGPYRRIAPARKT